MKTVLLLAVMAMSGCGFGYEVDDTVVAKYGADNRNATGYDTVYRCRRVRPILWYDYTLAMCTTKEECNKICMDLETKALVR